MPWGAMNMPAPKLFSTLPSVSNLRTVSISLIWPVARSRQLLAPHRSATQTDFPSLSMSTALVDPIFLPPGSLAQCSIVRYGFDASLVGCVSEEAAYVLPPANPAAMTATARELVIRRRRGINDPPP